MRSGSRLLSVTFALATWRDVLADGELAGRLQQVHEDFRLIDRETFFWYPRPLEGPAAPRNPIEELAEIVDPLGAAGANRTPLASRTDGVVFSRRRDRFVRPGQIVAKVAGEQALTDRSGRLLSD